MSRLREGMSALIILSAHHSNVGLPVLLEADLGYEWRSEYRGYEWLNGTGQRAWGVKALNSHLLVTRPSGAALARFSVVKEADLMALVPEDEAEFLAEMERDFTELDGVRHYRFLPRPPAPRA